MDRGHRSACQIVLRITEHNTSNPHFRECTGASTSRTPKWPSPRFQTLAVPGGTGFVAGTQHFGRNLEPQFGFDAALSKQVEHAAKYLEAQISFNPPALPPSGQLVTFEPELPNWTKEATEVWIITQVDSLEVIEALDILADHPHNNLTAFLSPNHPGHPSHSAWNPTREFSLGELKTELETDKIKRHAEQDRIRKEKKKEDEARRFKTEEEAKRLLPVQKITYSNIITTPRSGPKPAFLVAGGIVFIVLVAIAAFAMGRGCNTPPPPPPPPPPTIPTQDGCMDAKALNFDRYATDSIPTCTYENNLIVIESNTEGTHIIDSVLWKNHRFKDEPIKIQFNGDPDLLSPFQTALAQLTSIPDYDGIDLSASGLAPETIELSLSFPAPPQIDQLVIPDLGETCGALLSEIRLFILSDDNDIDKDGVPASKDRYPRFGGKCDGVDSDGDGVDDAIDIDDDDDEVADVNERNGCDDGTACNFDPSATENDNTCIYARGACEVCQNGEVRNLDADGDGVCDSNEKSGCTNRQACNYDPTATDDDGSCNPKDECGRCAGEDTGPGANRDCGCSDIPAGDCDCEGNQLDALGTCGGDCQIDSDDDGICDDNGKDQCTDTTAPNYKDQNNEPCQPATPLEPADANTETPTETPAAVEQDVEPIQNDVEGTSQPANDVNHGEPEPAENVEQSTDSLEGEDDNDDF